MSSRPITIAITGPDGSGKSTAAGRVSELLSGRFGADSVRIASVWDALSSSGLFTSRESVADYLGRLEPVARCLFIFHAMSQSLSLALKAEPRFLLIDGHVYKYAASELAYGVADEIVLGAARGFARPDRVFFLEIDPATAQDRKQSVSRYEQGESGFLEFQDRMGQTWRKLEERFGPWRHIPAGGSPGETAQLIFEETLRITT
ncbi:MAG TPA: hypothetical protein VM598_13930 [Bdellovibrionota bacterium]|nr:hypothetical protein [Bdellovibrionota bacterium]